MKISEILTESWSQKYKSSINCTHPKGFSQKAHCAGKKKHNESVEMEMTCPDCGMCETHGDHSQQNLDEACWKGYHKDGMKTMFGKRYPNCIKNKNESLETYIRKGECPGCGGSMVAEEQLNEKQDACYHKVKSRYKVWPSAYASGALVQCRKKGAANWGNSNESITQEEYDQLDENLKKWFSDKWVRFGPDGKIKGDCARGDSSEGKPKCLPQSKAHSLGKKGRASAAARKRRQDPDAERSGKAINVNTKKESMESRNAGQVGVKKKSKQVLGTRRHTNEATDPKFVGFMNKALGDKADPEPTTTELPAEYSKFQVMSFNNMPGYKPALKFGMRVLQAMDQKTRQRFINAPDDDLIVYMLSIADKKGFMPKYFVEEDLDEVTDWFDEIFADPNLHSWTDLLKSMSGKPDVAEASYNKNTKHLHTEIIKLNVGNWVVYVDDHAAIRSMIRSIGPRMMYDIIYYVDKIPNLENRVPIGGAFWIQDNKTNSSFYFKRLDIPSEPLAVRCETGVKDVPRAGWKTPVFKGDIYQGPETPQHIEYMKKAKLISRFVGINTMASTLTRNVQKKPTDSKNQTIIRNPEMQDSNRYERAFLKTKQLKDMSESNLKEFAPSGSSESGRWYTDDQMTDLVGDGWWNDLDISGAISKQQMIQEAQAWLDDQGYSVQVLNCKVNDDNMEWYIEGSFHNPGFAKQNPSS